MHPSRDSRFIRLILIFFFVIAAGYAIYEAQGLFYGPEIHLEKAASISYESFTTIEGRAERITELRLNGKTISVRENGEFEESSLLAEGSNRLILEARDARGRTTRETLDIVYRAPERPVSVDPETPEHPAASSTPTTTTADAP
jgi:hypothetical protein